MQVNSLTPDSTDIVCFSLSRWDAPISSPAVSIAREFSKSHRVFFIEHPYSFKDYLKERKSADTYRDGNVTVITPPLVYPVNFLPEGKLYDVLSAVNNRMMLRLLRSVLAEHQITRYIFINFFDPFFLRVIPPGMQRPVKFVYQCMDDISQVAYTRRHGIRLEEEIILNADVTLCTSQALTKMKSKFSTQVYFHPNAADTQLFRKAYDESFALPADMDFDGKKIIGFTGSIEYRTDFELLDAVARYHHDKIVFLVGPVAGAEHRVLQSLRNVVFAGARPLGELPAYVQHFDCTIIPYKKNVLTNSIYPLKINEYLAAGKPVVATNFSADIRSFRDLVYVADTADEFIGLIDTAIDEDSADKKRARAEAAAANSWEVRVSEFWKIVGVS